MNLGTIINTEANERSPALSRDGHYLFFATTRAGGSGGFDIWVSWRHDTRDDFGWQTPVNLGTQFNSPRPTPARPISKTTTAASLFFFSPAIGREAPADWTSM